ncbi:MAG: LamG-like jellyroll fold domain-containing protein [Verrucomicrobiales bacterium]
MKMHSKLPVAIFSWCIPLLLAQVPVAAQTLSDDLISYWPLDDGLVSQNSRDVVDLKEANTLELFAPDDSSPWLTGADAKFRGALHVNGDDTYGTVADSASLDIGTDAVTLALWVYLEQLPSEIPGSFGAIFDSQADQYVIYLDKGNNELRFKVTAADGAERPGIPAADLVVGQWLHITGVHDGTESRIYLNGVMKDTHAGPTGLVNAGQIAGLGRNGPDATNFFSGGIDEIAIWSRALTDTEIQEVIGGGVSDLFDSDGDGLRDDWEMMFFGNLDQTADGDSDGDLLTNDKEFDSGADPTETDTDVDGLDDYAEVVTHGSNPLSKDSDGDTLEDGSEVNVSGTSPILADSDGDGLTDGEELNRAEPLNPLLADSDGDDLNDGDEVNRYSTDPLKADSDSDTFADAFEVRDGGDPNDAAIIPRMARLGLNSGLVSLWTFDDKLNSGLADHVKDALGVNDLTLISDNADAAWLDGLAAKNRGSLRVDGVATYLPVPNSESLNGGVEKLTLSLWVNLDQLPAEMENGFGGIFDSVEDAYVLYLDKGNNELRFKVSATGAERPGIPAAALLTGEWLHIAGVYDGVAGTAKIYLNGELMDTHNAPTGPVKAGQVAAIGRNGATAENPFSGAVDDLALWNEALTEAQIATLFTGVPPGDGDSDDDGLLDEWETQFFGSLEQDGEDDQDMDQLTNAEELDAMTNPTLADTDEDGLTDGRNQGALTNALSADTDGDTYPDAFEVRDGGDPVNADILPRLAVLGVADGLLAFWNMDEATDSTEINDVKAQNDLKLSETAPNGTRLVGDEAQRGNSINIDGFDSYIDVPASATLDPGGAVTLAAWVKLRELPSEQAEAFAGIYDSTSDNYVMYVDRGNDELRFKVTATGAERPGIPASELVLDEWMHVAGVYDGAAGTAKIYLNGVLMDTHNGPTGNIAPGQVAAIGRNGAEAVSFFNGAVDNVGVWNVPLTEQQIGSLVRNTPFDPADTDADGLLDEWELANFGNLDRDSDGDFDEDGLTEAEELEIGSSPILADTDSDGASDSYEFDRGTDPSDPDSTPIPAGTGLAAGLTAYWPFDDGLVDPEAASIVDATGVNPLEYTYEDPERFWLGEADARSGGALGINGVDSFVTVPASKSLDIGGDALTLSAWVRLTELPSEQAEGFGGIYDSSSDAYVFYLDKGNAELRFKVTATGAERPGIPESELVLNQWIHIAGVYDGSASEARIYLNGVLMDTHGGPTGIVRAGQVAGIGRNGTDEASFFNGAIDDLAIWSRALTPEEVASLAAGAPILGGEEPTIDFRIADVARGQDGLVLTWASTPGATYEIQFNPTLSEAGWTAVQSGIAASADASTSYTDASQNAATEGYYRVRRE